MAMRARKEFYHSSLGKGEVTEEGPHMSKSIL
jgi:hypothetical protein